MCCYYMILCNQLVQYIIHFVDIETLCRILLYIPSLKDDIGKSYCLSNNIFNDIHNITTYSNTLLYFQNNYIYMCYQCDTVIANDYYMVICPCITHTLGIDIVYTKYHTECMNTIIGNDSSIGCDSSIGGDKLKIIKCRFCNSNRMCFACHIYS